MVLGRGHSGAASGKNKFLLSCFTIIQSIIYLDLNKMPTYCEMCGELAWKTTVFK